MKKALAVILLLALVVSLLAGCSSTSTSSQPVADVTAPTTTSETSDLQGELVYWSNWNETETQGLVLSQAIKEFEKINPGVKIKVVWNGRENRKLLLPALESGQQVDFFEQAVDLVLGSLGDYLLDLTPYYSQVYSTTDGKPYEEVVMQSLVSLIKTRKEGGIYAVPYQPNMYAVLYNKEHFKEAGIEKTPTTWDEFLDACEKLKQAGYTPLTADDAYLGNLLALHMERYMGEEYLSNTVNGTDSSMWDNPLFAKGFNDFKTLMDKGYLSPAVLSNKYPAGQQDIALGDVTMYVNGTWLPNEVMTTAGTDFEWGVFPYPVLDASVSDATHLQFNCQALGINKNTKYPEAAFAFAVFITTGEWDKKLSAETYGIPMNAEAEWPVQLQDAKPILQNATTRIGGSMGLLENSEKTPTIIETFVNVLNGSLSPEKAVEKLK